MYIYNHKGKVEDWQEKDEQRNVCAFLGITKWDAKWKEMKWTLSKENEEMIILWLKPYEELGLLEKE